MKTLKKYMLMLAGLSAGMMSCQNELDEYNPSGITAEGVYTTPDGFESLVNAAYSYTRWWYGKEDGYNLSEMGTDLWVNGVDGGANVALVHYENLQSNQGSVETLWARMYEAVNLCNAGLEFVGESGLSSELQQQREAEIRFLRAFYNWHIVEAWGGVHLSTERTKTAQPTANRNSVEEFYALIKEDLNFAVANLPYPASEKGRVSKAGAEAFLARVHLTRGEYSEAQTLAEKVIDSYDFQLMENYDDLWDMTHVENSQGVINEIHSKGLDQNDASNNITFPNGHSGGGHNGHLHFLSTYDRNGKVSMNEHIGSGKP